MIQVNRRIQDNNDFDGNIHLQDLTGSAQLRNDDPIDTDAMAMNDESFLYASGRLRKNIGKNIRGFQANRAKKKVAKAKRGGGLVEKIVTGQQRANLALAKAQQMAAKNLGSTDPALAAALTQPVDAPTPEPRGMSMGAKIGIGAGVALLLGIGIFFAIKKKK